MYPIKGEKKDDRAEIANARQRAYGVTRKQSISPLAGYYAGVLYLRGNISARHLGHYYSFLQTLPRGSLKSGSLIPRVQGGRPSGGSDVGSKQYDRMIKELNKHEMSVLHALANDQLIVDVIRLKQILELVPLTRSGEQFSYWCESQYPNKTGG